MSESGGDQLTPRGTSPGDHDTITKARASSRRFQIKQLLILTAAIGLFLLLSMRARFVAPWIVPVAVFIIALEPYFGRFDIPIGNGCFGATLWASAVNAIATPISLIISEANIVESGSPHHRQDLSIPVSVFVIGVLFLSFIGATIGVLCSVVLSFLAFCIREIAARGR
jgi:hypothetical protein